MSILYVTEFADVGRSFGMYQIAALPVNTDQYVSFTGTAGQSAALQNNTRVIRVSVDGIANVAFGTNPTAVAGQNARFSAGQTEYFFPPQGKSFKVSAVTASA